MFVIAERTVMLAVSADGVEGFQGKTKRVEFGMTPLAALHGTMLHQKVAQGLGAANVRFTPGMLGGGGVGVFPRIRSITHTPRITGEVLVPLAVTLSTPLRQESAPGRVDGQVHLAYSRPVSRAPRSARQGVR